MDIIQRKQVAIAAIATLYSLCFFLLLSLAFQGQTQTLAVPFVLVLIGVVWIAMMALFLVVAAPNQPYQWALVVLPFVTALVSSRFQGVAIVGSVLLLVALVSAQRSIHRELANRIKFTTVSIFRPGVRLLLLGVASFALSLALPVVKNQTQAGQITISAQTTSTFMQPFIPLLRQSIPNYQPTMTIDQVIQNQINQQQIPAGFELPPDQLQRSRRELGDRVKLNLSGNETVPQIISQVMNRYIQDIAQGDGLIVTLVLVLLALIAIRALIPFIIWPVLLIILGLVFLAHRTHLIKKVLTQVTVERYQL